MTQTRLDWSVPFGQTWIFDKNDAVNGDFSWIFDSGVTVASSSNLLLYHVTNNNISISAVLNCPNNSYITLTKGANQHQFAINKTKEKETPDVPDDGGQEVQYTTIYFGQTDTSSIINKPDLTLPTALQDPNEEDFTYINPNELNYTQSGNGYTVYNPIKISGSRSNTIDVNNYGHPSTFFAIPIDWEVKSWTENAGSGSVYNSNMIYEVNRGDYKLVYYSSDAIDNVNNHSVVIGKK